MKLISLLVPSVLATNVALAQLGLQNGFLSLKTSKFSMQLVTGKDSQTLYSLKTLSGGFYFIPADKMAQRQGNGQYHLGDITFRTRLVGSPHWISGDSAAARHPVTTLPASGSTLASANLAPTLSPNSLLSITRRWALTKDASNQEMLQLLFDVTNSQMSAVEIGALGIPLEFNNVSDSLSLVHLLGDKYNISDLQ
jgi:hypothetical protein